jgi:hypothetical protein
MVLEVDTVNTDAMLFHDLYVHTLGSFNRHYVIDFPEELQSLLGIILKLLLKDGSCPWMAQQYASSRWPIWKLAGGRGEFFKSNRLGHIACQPLALESWTIRVAMKVTLNWYNWPINTFNWMDIAFNGLQDNHTWNLICCITDIKLLSRINYKKKLIHSVHCYLCSKAPTVIVA